jgi:hypothetical protein
MAQEYTYAERCAQYARQQKQEAEEARLRQQRDDEGRRAWEQQQYQKQQAAAATQAASNARIVASEEAVHRHYGKNAVKSACADLTRMQKEHPERLAALRRKAVEMGVLLT